MKQKIVVSYVISDLSQLEDEPPIKVKKETIIEGAEKIFKEFPNVKDEIKEGKMVLLICFDSINMVLVIPKKIEELKDLWYLYPDQIGELK